MFRASHEPTSVLVPVPSFLRDNPDTTVGIFLFPAKTAPPNVFVKTKKLISPLDHGDRFPNSCTNRTPHNIHPNMQWRPGAVRDSIVSYRHACIRLKMACFHLNTPLLYMQVFVGGQYRIRTCDLCDVNAALLNQTELIAHGGKGGSRTHVLPGSPVGCSNQSNPLFPWSR